MGSVHMASFPQLTAEKRGFSADRRLRRDDEDVHVRLRFDLRHRHQESFEPHRETDCRRVRTPETLHQLVVPSASEKRVLGAEPLAFAEHFEEGAGVVVEAAHERTDDSVRRAQLGERLLQSVEVRTVVVGEVFQNRRRIGCDFDASRDLAVEHSEYVALEAPLADSSTLIAPPPSSVKKPRLRQCVPPTTTSPGVYC